MPWVALAVMAVGAVVSTVGAMQQGRAQKEAMQAQSRMQSLKAARERTAQIRERNQRVADIQQAGENVGAGQSSAVAGGAGGVGSQAMSNIQYLGFEEQTGQNISRAQQKEVDAQGIGSLGKGISSIGEVMGSPAVSGKTDSLRSDIFG